jgi:hypothetical protein
MNESQPNRDGCSRRFSAPVPLKITPKPAGRGWTTLSYATYTTFGGIELWNPFLTGPTLERRDMVIVSGQVNQP